MIEIHKDIDLFREAIAFTTAQTHFLPRLIEKDYYCTILLHYLATAAPAMVFKGGTCLAKIHIGFYRLSEDLDFVIPMPITASRSKRRANSAGFKEAINQIPHILNSFYIIKPLTGANNSTQYIAVIGYTSSLNQQKETVKIEIGLREPLLTGTINGEVHTLLLNPISGKPMTQAFPLPCISMREAMAEKLRAALSRRDVAIRDFFDVDYAIQKMAFQPLDGTLIALVRHKLAMPGNSPVDVSKARHTTLQQQLDAQLKPVLRATDFAAFDLERAFKAVTDVAAILAK